MKFQKMKNLQQNVGCQRLEVWYVSTMLICERFLHGTSPCGKVGVYIALKHTCNDMTSVQSPPKASTWLCLGWVKFHTENVFPTCNNSGTFPAWVLTCRIWDSRILVLSLWEEDDHLGRGTAVYTGAGLPGWVWAGMKTSPTLWFVDMSWGSAWPHSRGGRTYSCGGDTAPEHPRKQELRTGPLSSFLHKLHISWPKGLVTTFWQRVSSQDKAPSPDPGAAPGGPTRGTMKKPTWNRGLSLLEGTLQGSSLGSCSCNHRPPCACTPSPWFVFLKGGSCFACISHVPSWGSCGLQEAVMLVGLFSAHKARMSQQHSTPSNVAEEAGGFNFVLFSFSWIFLLLCQALLMELPETCRITAFVWLDCEKPHCIAATCHCSEFIFSWLPATNTSILLGLFPLKDSFLSLTFFVG